MCSALCPFNSQCRHFNDDQMDESFVATPINRKLREMSLCRRRRRRCCCLSWSTLTCLCLTASLSSRNIAVVIFYSAHMQCHNLYHKCYSRKTNFSRNRSMYQHTHTHSHLEFCNNACFGACGGPINTIKIVWILR